MTGNSMTGQSKPGHRKSIRCHQTQTLTLALPTWGRTLQAKEDNVRDAYIDAASVKLTTSTEEDDTRYVAYGAYSSAQLRNRKSSVMKNDACSDIPNRNQKSSVMKDDTQSSVILRNRKKKEDRSLKTEESKTKGNMQVETDTGQTVYIHCVSIKRDPNIIDCNFKKD